VARRRRPALGSLVLARERVATAADAPAIRGAVTLARRGRCNDAHWELQKMRSRIGGAYLFLIGSTGALEDRRALAKRLQRVERLVTRAGGQVLAACLRE
jgi:hypothetical protein